MKLDYNEVQTRLVTSLLLYLVRSFAYGAMIGTCTWIPLFFVGFHFDFGDNLTFLYGRDLINGNADFLLLYAILIGAGFVAFMFVGAIGRFRPEELGLGVRLVCLLIPPLTIMTLIFWICRTIRVNPTWPTIASLLVALCCSWAVTPVMFTSSKTPKIR